MTRRGAYLLVWGVAYAALGILLVEDKGHNLGWEIGFVSGGLVSVIAGITKPLWLDTVGFVILSFFATSRALAYIVELAQGGDSLGYFATALWLAVAISHIIVAGWPDKPTVGVPWPEGAERRGIS